MRVILLLELLVMALVLLEDIENSSGVLVLLGFDLRELDSNCLIISETYRSSVKKLI